MAKKTIKKSVESAPEQVEKTEQPKPAMVRIYSRNRDLVRVLVFTEDDLGDFTEETKIIQGNEFIELEASKVGWDIGNKIKSGLLRVRAL